MRSPDPALIAILECVDPAGNGPDGPLFDPKGLAGVSALDRAEERLLEVVRDSGQSDSLRFAAANALIEGGWSTWRNQADSRSAVASCLVATMRKDLSHNRWGLPGEFVGPYGERLLGLADGGVAPLRMALDDPASLSIEGSEAHTIQVAAKYRVADLSGWLLTRILGTDWPDNPDPAVRDESMRCLRN